LVRNIVRFRNNATDLCAADQRVALVCLFAARRSDAYQVNKEEPSDGQGKNWDDSKISRTDEELFIIRSRPVHANGLLSERTERDLPRFVHCDGRFTALAPSVREPSNGKQKGSEKVTAHIFAGLYLFLILLGMVLLIIWGVSILV